MKLPFLMIFFLIFFLSACTTTYVKRTDGQKTFEAGNTSWGWEREDMSLTIKKEDGTELEISIGKSSGKEGLDRTIEGLEESLETLKALRP